MRDGLVAVGIIVSVIFSLGFFVVLGARQDRVREVEARWCAELFAAPQADTLAILRTHDFCKVPR